MQVYKDTDYWVRIGAFNCNAQLFVSYLYGIAYYYSFTCQTEYPFTAAVILSGQLFHMAMDESCLKL